MGWPFASRTASGVRFAPENETWKLPTGTDDGEPLQSHGYFRVMARVVDAKDVG